MDIKERLKEHDAVEKSHNLYERNELAENILESLRSALGDDLLCQIVEAPDRVVVLPPFVESFVDGGLQVKYRVYKARNGEPVEDCFILRPDKDPAARAALMAYAAATDNEELHFDIYSWVEALEERDEAAAALKGADQ